MLTKACSVLAPDCSVFGIDVIMFYRHLIAKNHHGIFYYIAVFVNDFTKICNVVFSVVIRAYFGGLSFRNHHSSVVCLLHIKRDKTNKND